ncbi:hypothetical protein [Rothia sp. ZJ1223]|uniref:hypothetical protein n=1 Tax=Rothia sp. ZJ1223 TaxID=2811098 RepID=UPI00195E37E4|nr:hypothetical protein [Rothia sp. ZJ1223]MBM7051443.1 hypothetical protein [Rothia sp. ZJ1223]
MNVLLSEALILAADLSTVTPSIQQYNADGSPLGSPGITGALVTMILGVLIILLGLDLTRRTRRLRYRMDYALAREEQEKQGAHPKESPRSH